MDGTAQSCFLNDETVILRVVLSHPSDKNRDVGRMGHPELFLIGEG